MSMDSPSHSLVTADFSDRFVKHINLTIATDTNTDRNRKLVCIETAGHNKESNKQEVYISKLVIKLMDKRTTTLMH